MALLNLPVSQDLVLTGAGGNSALSTGRYFASSLPFPLTESDTPLLREPCPDTRLSGLQIHCKREGPHGVHSVEHIQRESSSLHARSSRGRGVAAGYTGAKRASSLASALLRLYSTRRSSDK